MLNESVELKVSRFAEEGVNYVVIVDREVNVPAEEEYLIPYYVRGNFTAYPLNEVLEKLRPDLIRGEYPDEGQCLVEEIYFLRKGLSLGKKVQKWFVAGTFGGWSIDPRPEVLLVGSVEGKPDGFVQVIKFGIGELNERIEELIDQTGCPKCIKVIGLSEGAALDFLKAYYKLSNAFFVTSFLISLVAMASVNLLRMRGKRCSYGLHMTVGRSVTDVFIREAIIYGSASAAGAALGLALSWNYGRFFGEVVVGSSLVNVWRYRPEFFLGSLPYVASLVVVVPLSHVYIVKLRRERPYRLLEGCSTSN